jgi:hypothetical protein
MRRRIFHAAYGSRKKSFHSSAIAAAALRPVTTATMSDTVFVVSLALAESPNSRSGDTNTSSPSLIQRTSKMKSRVVTAAASTPKCRKAPQSATTTRVRQRPKRRRGLL